MSVLGHLQAKASAAVLSGTEQASINTSITTLSSRLSSYFGANLVSQFRFGSSTRGTILPRSMDDASDIDYMVVLKEDGSLPQAYLNRLKRFAVKYYSSSDIWQSNPSIVLELNHIKFDLVPAIPSWGTWYKIPDGTSSWKDTNPNDFNDALSQKNKDTSHLIKPSIRLAKYWNSKNGYVFNSYELEKWIIAHSYWGCTNQKDFLFAIFDNIAASANAAQWRKDKVARAKQIVQNVRDYERAGYLPTAELEIKKLVP